jgi:hypothetical protein
MSYECDDCGASFDTLSRLRLHDCTPDQPAGKTDSHEDGPSEEAPVEDSGLDRQELERDYPEVVGDLPELYDDACEGDVSTLYPAMAEYERVLTKVARGDAPGGEDLLHDLRFAYYEAFADGLDTAGQTEGWDVLVEFAEAYDPREQDEFPEVGHVIANAIGRSVIRTRRTDSVDAIPADALAFLGAIPEYVDEFHVAYEESYTYGWGIGHPDHSVSDQLRALAETEHKWGRITLNTAFHADQYVAVETFERLVTDDSLTGTVQRITYEAGLPRYYFGAVADLKQDFAGPHVPVYWEFEDEYDYAFELDPEVEKRIRNLAQETGVTEDLPDDWRLHELDPGPLSELTRMAGELSDEES